MPKNPARKMIDESFPDGAEADTRPPGFALAIGLGNSECKTVNDVVEILVQVSHLLIIGLDNGMVSDLNGNVIGAFTLTLPSGGRPMTPEEPTVPVYARMDGEDEPVGWALELARSALMVALILAMMISAVALTVGDVTLGHWLELLQSLK